MYLKSWQAGPLYFFSLLMIVGAISEHQLDNPYYFVICRLCHQLPCTSSLANISYSVVIDILTDETSDLLGATFCPGKESPANIDELFTRVLREVNVQGEP